jgi:3-oxoacyl-[acyl-carrier-protein] synthase-1
MNEKNSLKWLYIAGAGMITPIGGNTVMTIAAVNAGICQYQASSFFNKHDKPMTVTAVPDGALPPLHDDLKKIQLTGREKRLIRLAMPALQEVLSHYPSEQPLPLFLAGPEPLYNNIKTTTAKLLTYIKAQTNANIDLPSSRYFTAGRSGLIDAIDMAFRYFSATNAAYVVVGGVDTYLDAANLGNLDAEDRVLGEGMADAFAPGEGASFLLLRNPTIHNDEPQNGAVLFEPGIATEKGHRYSDEPYLGQGLADAFKIAIANGNGEKISTIFSTMNGENFFAKEFGVATIRNQSALDEKCRHEHPIDCFGDMGAATAGVLLALAQHRLLKSKTITQNLVYCSSDMAGRGAICLTKID